MVKKHPVLLKRTVVKIFIVEIRVPFLCLNEETEIQSLCVIVQAFRAGWVAPAAAVSIGKRNRTPEHLFLMSVVKDKVMGSFSFARCQ